MGWWKRGESQRPPLWKSSERRRRGFNFDHPSNVTTEHTQFIERGGDDVAVVVQCWWSYDPGQSIEPGHPDNGYGRGWTCDKVTAAREDDETAVELTETEEQQAIKEGREQLT